MGKSASKLKDKYTFQSTSCKSAPERSRAIAMHMTADPPSKLLESKRKNNSTVSLPASKKVKLNVLAKHNKTAASLKSLTSFAETNAIESTKTFSKKVHSVAPKPIVPARKEAPDEDATKKLEEEARAKDEKRKSLFS